MRHNFHQLGVHQAIVVLTYFQFLKFRLIRELSLKHANLILHKKSSQRFLDLE